MADRVIVMRGGRVMAEVERDSKHFNQEDIMKACWDDGDRLRRAYGNPEHLIRYGARDIHDPETGMKLPETIAPSRISFGCITVGTTWFISQP